MRGFFPYNDPPMVTLDPSFYDRANNLVNVGNSILQAYGVTPFHPSLPILDEKLKGHRKIALFLFDGAGEANLQTNRRQSRFLREHKLTTVYSTNPATTVAATTSLLTAKYPSETGWLGWSLQMDDLGFPVDVFPNRNSLTSVPLAVSDLMASRFPVKNLDAFLGEAGVKAKLLYGYPVFPESSPKTLRDFMAQAQTYFQKENGEFLYAYWPHPDTELHSYGTVSRHVRSVFREINHRLKRFVKENPDVLVISLADHGLIDVQYRDMAAFPELASRLRKPLSLEGRTRTFFVAPGEEEAFAKDFRRLFPDWALLSREEALAKGYFGPGPLVAGASGFIGDFVAVSLGKDYLINSADHLPGEVKRGHHAGGTPAERNVLIAVYNAD